MAPRVIVVGGGLAGLSAAHTLYLSGANVVVLDKQGKERESNCVWESLGRSLTELVTRIFRWKFNQGYLGYQRCSHSDAGG